MSSLKSKLSRLHLAPAEAPPSAPPRSVVLDDLRDRMQAVLERTVLRERPPPRAVETSELPFLTHETPLGPLHVRRYTLSAAHRIGRAPVYAGRGASAELLALLALDPRLAPCDPARALYLDTETTGLSGGAGTVAFLVGLGYFSAPGGAFVMEQLLVRNLGEEAPMLERVAARIRDASMLVTFNGKSFDLPLLRARFVMARMAMPEEPPHFDLVHVARRLHKARGVECKLTSIERAILGFERIDDVPGGEVSACYLHFLRTGDTRALLGVVEHNAWDVIAMAALVGLYGEPLEGSQLAAEDLVGLARTLKRAGAVDHAFEVATRAVERGAGAESYRARAEISKARGDRARALADFESLTEQVDCGRARLELAKLYEHFMKEPARALALVAQGTLEPVPHAEKRAARLTEKIAKQAKKRQAELFAPSKARLR